MADKNFFAGLFDLSFSEFITIKIIKVIFIIAIVLAGIGALAFLGSGFAMLKARSVIGLLMILASPFLFLLYVILGRIWCEIIMVVFRIAENTGKLVEQQKS